MSADGHYESFLWMLDSAIVELKEGSELELSSPETKKDVYLKELIELCRDVDLLRVSARRVLTP